MRYPSRSRSARHEPGRVHPLVCSTFLLGLVALLTPLLSAAPVLAQSAAEVFEDTCEGERCQTTGTWALMRNAIVYEAASEASAFRGVLRAGQDIAALKTDLHITPGRYRLSAPANGQDAENWRNRITIPAGKEVLTYRYLGEGFVDVTYQGKHYTVDFPQGSYIGPETRVDRWVKIRHEGHVGWLLNPETRYD